MDQLYNDIKRIVYRYLFIDRYDAVMKQYKQKWLSGDPWCSCWCDEDSCFKYCRLDGKGKEANWRILERFMHMKCSVYKFNILSKRKYVIQLRGPLPVNY